MKSSLILVLVLATFGGCAALNKLSGGQPVDSNADFVAKIKAANEIMGEGASNTVYGSIGAAIVASGWGILSALKKRKADKKLTEEQLLRQKIDAVLGVVVRGGDYIRKKHPEIKAEHGEFVDESLVAAETDTPFTITEMKELIRSKKTK